MEEHDNLYQLKTDWEKQFGPGILPKEKVALPTDLRESLLAIPQNHNHEASASTGKPRILVFLPWLAAAAAVLLWLSLTPFFATEPDLNWEELPEWPTVYYDFLLQDPIGYVEYSQAELEWNDWSFDQLEDEQLEEIAETYYLSTPFAP